MLITTWLGGREDRCGLKEGVIMFCLFGCEAIVEGLKEGVIKLFFLLVEKVLKTVTD